MYKSLLVLLIATMSFSACSLKYNSIGNINKNIDSNTKKTRKSKTFKAIGFDYHPATKDQILYAPTEKNKEWTEIKTIRVNVHFLHDSTSNENIPPKDAYEYARSMLYAANNGLKNNRKMRLPEGNKTPVLSINYRYELFPDNEDAIFIHHDSELFNFIPRGKYRNNYSNKVIEKYAVGVDSILNIFVMPLDPDGIQMTKNPNYTSGIAMGHSLKISGNFHTQKTRAWKFTNILNHEIGHILGLSHAWTRSDGCDDTPAHNNCWNKTEDGKCNKIISNNMMDYNYSENALTPCQLGKVNQNIAKLHSKQRSLIIKDWCRLDKKETIIINDTIIWDASLDLNKNVTVNNGATLIIKSRISFPPNGQLYVAPGGTIILDKAYLHNDCGKTWKGIILGSKGRTKATIIYQNEVLIEGVETKAKNFITK